MLRIDVKQIPPEGLDLAEDLKPGEIHVQEKEEFVLEEGGSLRCHVELRDEDTVHVSGKLVARLGLGCGRCLEPFALPVDQQLQVFLLPHREDQGEEDEVELSERDMVVAYYREQHIDLGELIREQLYLAVPLKRLCREDCKGLCPSCGINRNREGCGCPAVSGDLRLASLGGLLGR
jgi:uncharacterized protein